MLFWLLVSHAVSDFLFSLELITDFSFLFFFCSLWTISDSTPKTFVGCLLCLTPKMFRSSGPLDGVPSWRRAPRAFGPALPIIDVLSPYLPLRISHFFHLDMHCGGESWDRHKCLSSPLPHRLLISNSRKRFPLELFRNCFITFSLLDKLFQVYPFPRDLCFPLGRLRDLLLAHDSHHWPPISSFLPLAFSSFPGPLQSPCPGAELQNPAALLGPVSSQERVSNPSGLIAGIIQGDGTQCAPPPHPWSDLNLKNASLFLSLLGFGPTSSLLQLSRACPDQPVSCGPRCAWPTLPASMPHILGTAESPGNPEMLVV